MAVRALRATLNELQVYADRSASPLECLRAVSIALPPGVTMNSFVYVKGQDLKIRGEAREAQAVYDFVSALEDSELFPAVHNDGVNTRAGQTAFQLTAFLPGSTNAPPAVADTGAGTPGGGAS
jgi:Tfp pilus assembly protein PilN